MKKYDKNKSFTKLSLSDLNKPDVVNTFLENGGNANNRMIDRNGYKDIPLHIAIKQGYVETVRLLFNHGYTLLTVQPEDFIEMNYEYVEMKYGWEKLRELSYILYQSIYNNDNLNIDMLDVLLKDVWASRLLLKEAVYYGDITLIKYIFSRSDIIPEDYDMEIAKDNSYPILKLFEERLNIHDHKYIFILK